MNNLVSSPEPRVSQRLWVCASLRLFSFSNMNISATSWPIKVKFYLKHDRGGGGGGGVGEWLQLGFDRIRTLVSMATVSSHRVLMEKKCCHFFLAVFHPILFILAGNDDMHEISREFEIWPDQTPVCGVSCPLASEKISIDLLYKCCHFFSAVLRLILFILAGDGDIH